MKKYEEIRSHMKSGDVIAFSGKGRVSEIIKWKTGSPYSHVGMVFDADISGAFGKTVLLIESTSLNNLPDAYSKQFIKGVQMHFLSDRLSAYDGKAWWVPLENQLPEYSVFNMQKWLRSTHSQKVKYDTLGAIGAGADLFDWIPGIENEPDFSSLFCSELVCKALQIAGVADYNLNPSEITPGEVVSLPCFKGRVEIT